VVRQKYKPDQVVISDNASDDNTMDVVNEFTEIGLNIKYYRQPTNIGMLKNWQHAIGMIDTSYFLVLADDDYLLPNCLEIGMPILKADSRIGLFCGVTIALNENFEPSGTAPSNLAAINKRKGFDLLTYMLQHPGSTGSIISKKHYEQVGGFREQSGYLADLSIMLRVAAISDIIVVDEPVAIYSASGTYSRGNFFNRWYPGCLDIFEQLQQLGVRHQFAYKRYVARTLFFSCAWLLINLCTRDKNLKANFNVFKSIFKYLTPSIVGVSFLEGFRVMSQSMKNKAIKSNYLKSKLIEYYKLHKIVKQIADANT
jgi:glycosyltransferase involved in cell wall biosynthesis